MKLQNRIALVTGASRGIGAAIARRLASDGATVAAVYNTQRSAAEDMAGSIRRAGGHAAIFQADVSDERAVNAMVKEVVARFGRIEILANAAGIFEAAPVGQISRELFHNELFTHAWSVVAMTQAVLPHFPASGGAIVNISTTWCMSPAMAPPSIRQPKPQWKF
jgi:3-oxoacyl-[acyl-carrier protein] reductase